jgi:hypothetical protein
VSRDRETFAVPAIDVAVAYAWTVVATTWTHSLWNLLWFPLLIVSIEGARADRERRSGR